MANVRSFRRFRIDAGRYFVTLDVEQLVDAMNSIFSDRNVDADNRYHLEARLSTDESVYIHVIDKEAIWKELNERFTALPDPHGMIPSNVEGHEDMITHTEHLMYEFVDRYCEGLSNQRDDVLSDEIDHYLQGLRSDYCQRNNVAVDDEDFEDYVDGFEVDQTFHEEADGPDDEALRDEVQAILESLDKQCPVYASARQALLDMCRQDDLADWISIDVDTFHGQELVERIKYWFCTRAMNDNLPVERVQHFMKEHNLHGCDFDFSETKRAEMFDFLSDMAFK